MSNSIVNFLEGSASQKISTSTASPLSGSMLSEKLLALFREMRATTNSENSPVPESLLLKFESLVHNDIVLENYLPSE